MLPVYDHESFSHVSLPNSPGDGIVWKIQSRLPVRTSYPRTYPFSFRMLLGAVPAVWAAPMTTTSLAMSGVACRPMSAVSMSIF